MFVDKATSLKVQRGILDRIRNCKATHNDYRLLSTRINGADLAQTEEFERGGYTYID